MICLVDDDLPLLRAMRRLLMASGFEVEICASAECLMQCGAAARSECIVLDVRLGKASGFDLHDRLRAAGCHAPIIFITATDDDLLRERARRIGAAAYLTKPFSDTPLPAVINRVLKRAA